MLACGIAWGLAHALAQRGHVRIDVLVNHLPRPARVWLHLVALALLGVLAGFLAKGAWDLVDESLLFGASDISALRTPLAIPQGIWAAGLFVFLLLILAMLVENLLLVLAGDQRQVERNLSTRSYTEEAEETLEALHAREHKP
jgi:TRAP-type C4-dicarboxylate transport system permease small subunit